LEGNIRGLILRYYPGNRQEEMNKTMKASVRMVGLQAEMKAAHFGAI
jgi:hypothetical protein